MRKWKIAVRIAVGAGFGILAAVLIYRTLRTGQVVSVTGAVLREDADPKKQQPIGNAVITVQSGLTTGESMSDASGLFRVGLRPAVHADDPVQLTFRHPDYQAFVTTKPAGNEIYIIRLTPKSRETIATPVGPLVAITNVRVRYAVKSTTTANVGSTVKTFEVVNTGNVPCQDKSPCSPDGKWKASVGSVSMDAGDDRQFWNARVSCIAGPCPFTRIDSDGYTRGGRTIKVSVRNWSDTTTFLVEAEVTQTMAADIIRRSFPAIFDRSMNFTLPATAQGPSIEAELNGAEIVYPLGPELILSWASCNMELRADRTKLYRCELKAGYGFK
jgi:hypothetical protein